VLSVSLCVFVRRSVRSSVIAACRACLTEQERVSDEDETVKQTVEVLMVVWCNYVPLKTRVKEKTKNQIVRTRSGGDCHLGQEACHMVL
jgi:phosphoribosyl-AMP cyclohydrolase